MVDSAKIKEALYSETLTIMLVDDDVHIALSLCLVCVGRCADALMGHGPFEYEAR